MTTAAHPPIALRYRAGLCQVPIRDEALGLEFPGLVLYPTSAEETEAQVGPYTFKAAQKAAPAEGPFPLVILSHGSGGSPLLYRALTTHLARRGYVVVAPEHPGDHRGDRSLQGHDENTIRRPRHGSLALDAVLRHPDFAERIRPEAVVGVGHSMGATTLLAMAGGRPWSATRVPLPTLPDPRLRAAVLLAPATAWYQHPEALRDVTIPILVLAGSMDSITPQWQAQLILDRVPDRSRVTVEEIPNAGHFSFLSPFPAALRQPDFAPSQDPEGFDRDAFHAVYPERIAAFLDAALASTPSPGLR